MIFHGWLDKQPITVSLNQGVLTVAFDEGTVLAFDQSGRLVVMYAEGHHFHRSLNGVVLAKWVEKGVQQRHRLWRSEADLLIFRTSQTARDLLQNLVLETTPEIVAELRQILKRAADFDIVAARVDVNHFHRVYKPLGFLPPDQRAALVLQLTEGCPFKDCSACSFYQEHAFHIKSSQELLNHFAAVRAYLGEQIHFCQGIFLADANLLAAPQAQLTDSFDLIRREFKQTRIATFLDGFPENKSAEDYAALAQRGLQCVYIYLDSGHDMLRAWLGKVGQAYDAVHTMRQIKAGGVNLGVIVTLGIGGQRYNEGHVRDTISALNRVKLGQEDQLYFAEFTPLNAPHTAQSGAPDLWPLSRSHMQVQRQAIIAGLDFEDESLQASSYDVCEFVY
jgi:hypothetical protein